MRICINTYCCFRRRLDSLSLSLFFFKKENSRLLLVVTAASWKSLFRTASTKRFQHTHHSPCLASESNLAWSRFGWRDSKASGLVSHHSLQNRREERERGGGNKTYCRIGREAGGKRLPILWMVIWQINERVHAYANTKNKNCRYLGLSDQMISPLQREIHIIWSALLGKRTKKLNGFAGKGSRRLGWRSK